ncbi:hypothetical protein IPM19_03545 [bacterium]|nr:MAG: hypothetical protein IPM19_03545 [bacterium]
MQNKNTNLESLGFTRNHAYLLGAAVLVFAVLIVPRMDIKLSAVFTQAEETQEPMLTYEDVRSEVYALNGLDAETEEYINHLENQFALLDRGQANGQVLGEAIGLDEIPSVEQLYSNEQLSLIPIKEMIPTNQQTVEAYANKMLQIESYYNTPELFANLNSSDKNLLQKTQDQVKGIIESLNGIPVPTELVDYHRYNTLYYQTIGKLGLAFMTGDENIAQYSSAMFSLTDRLASLRTQIENKHKIKF